MPTVLDSVFRRIPVLNTALGRFRKTGFINSAEYWDKRYRSAGTSGSGSYGRLAVFKADFLNHFVEHHRVASVVEFGCGDGAQLNLAKYPDYVGVDVSDAAVDMCRARFEGDLSKRFLALREVSANISAELAISLDVIFHLVEDSVYEAYMRRLFEAARRFVIIYSSNSDKNVFDEHVRHRRFTSWVSKNAPEWKQQLFVPNAYPYDPRDPENTSFADFYVYERC